MARVSFDLAAIARQEMLRHGFQPDFPLDVQRQVDEIQRRAAPVGATAFQDLRALLWSSIDNSSSKDLDQIEFAETVDGGIRLLIAIADVDADVSIGTAIDNHARAEGTSVYGPGFVFPMLPDELSTGRTSLLPGEDRIAVVIEMVVQTGGDLGDTRVYPALVRNQCQLVYGRVGAWLEGQASSPADGASIELQGQLRLQEQAALTLREQRHRLGALPFDRTEAVPIVEDGQIRAIEARRKNPATDLIEDLMIAANEAMARSLGQSEFPAIRRVVRSPERWPRIVQLAAAHGTTLPETASAPALARFLSEQKNKDPDGYADLSLSVLKLMGPGEYVVVPPNATNPGHFGLASHDYTHSTAPNRRYADLVTQRLIKASLSAQASPYEVQSLQEIARTCTEREDAARKVERTLQKCAAAYALRTRVGQTFRGVVTGVTPNGTFARVVNPPVEGRIVQGEKGLDVGDHVRLKLLRTDPSRGYIDFAK